MIHRHTHNTSVVTTNPTFTVLSLVEFVFVPNRVSGTPLTASDFRPDTTRVLVLNPRVWDNLQRDRGRERGERDY